jgi:hypothetical protein
VSAISLLLLESHQQLTNYFSWPVLASLLGSPQA